MVPHIHDPLSGSTVNFEVHRGTKNKGKSINLGGREERRMDYLGRRASWLGFTITERSQQERAG